MRREKAFVENHAPNRGMTNQGNSFHGLIHSNFRAVKPFLDRKRPRECFGYSDRLPRKIRGSDAIEPKVQITSINRAPLTELPINTPSTCSEAALVAPDADPRTTVSNAIEAKVQITSISRAPLTELHVNTHPTCSKPGLAAPDAEPSCVSNNKSILVDSSLLDDDILDWFLADTSAENGFLSDSFVTPMRQAEKHRLSKTVSPPSLLDDDFDQSIFEEIDAICEQSAKKVVCQERTSCNSETRYANNKDSGFDVSPLGVTTVEHEPYSVAVMEPKEEIMSSFQPSVRESMPDKYSEFFQTLNDRQRDAACSDISIPLMIVAGPGSGKTSTMVGRVLMLLNEDIHPSNILAMTFTTAAAAEMRDRVAKQAGKKIAKELTISTFHSFSLQLCREHAEKLERTTEFLVYGQGQQRRAIIEAVRLFENETSKHDPVVYNDDSTNGLKCPDYYKDKSKKWQKFVTQAKASGKTPAECRKMGDEIGAMVLEHYNNILKSCDALDYHDLISCSVRLLDDYPEVLEESQCTWKAIIVDEFQDTSAMQYRLLLLLASHNHITIVGDDDQSIFSFNGADTSGFDSFRKDFENHKEVRLVKNYRSTRHIVEAASSLIKHNTKRCQSKLVQSDNSHGSKIIVKESYNEEAQCAFVIDKILESISDGSTLNCSYGNIAILYRRQVSGKVFQAAFRDRKIPFNVHGVAFYRKKVVKIIFAMLKTTLSECDDAPYRRVFKALLSYEKEEKKTIIEHIDKISTIRKCSFISAAKDIFRAKISGTFKRSQITQGRKVLSTLEMLSKLVHREQSLSAVLTSVANMVPQKYLLEQRAVVDFDGGKLLNENNDLRSVHQYLMDDVSDFLSAHFSSVQEETKLNIEQKGCTRVLKAFIDYIVERETENFRSRRYENNDSVTLTTIHQSKGLEWDIVFIVKANETEIPLLHESDGVALENGTSLEEERRLLYVAITRARKKVFILYVTIDSSWQVLQPSRFLKEIPSHLVEIQGELGSRCLGGNYGGVSKEREPLVSGLSEENKPHADTSPNKGENVPSNGASEESTEAAYAFHGNNFLKSFNVEDRSMISHLFHNWAKKKAFQEPRRLLDKVRFVIDERLTNKKNKNKDVLRALKTSLCCDEAFHYAEQIIRWEQIPADQRAHLMREKQEHFQRLRLEKSMSSSEPTSKQISYLKSLGCTATPTSRLHASRLIEQYKSL